MAATTTVIAIAITAITDMVLTAMVLVPTATVSVMAALTNGATRIGATAATLTVTTGAAAGRPDRGKSRGEDFIQRHRAVRGFAPSPLGCLWFGPRFSAL